MKIIRAKDYNDMSRKAANIISAQVILKPDSVLGLATGSSPIGIYEQLIKWYNKGDVDFGGCTTFNLDEYRGLTPDHDQSYHYFMHKNFFDAVNVPAERINLPDGAQLDAERECKRYDAAIKAAGGIRTLDSVIAMIKLGVTRFGISWNSAYAILDELEQRYPDGVEV